MKGYKKINEYQQKEIKKKLKDKEKIENVSERLKSYSIENR